MSGETLNSNQWLMAAIAARRAQNIPEALDLMEQIHLLPKSQRDDSLHPDEWSLSIVWSGLLRQPHVSERLNSIVEKLEKQIEADFSDQTKIKELIILSFHQHNDQRVVDLFKKAAATDAVMAGSLLKLCLRSLVERREFAVASAVLTHPQEVIQEDLSYYQRTPATPDNFEERVGNLKERVQHLKTILANSNRLPELESLLQRLKETLSDSDYRFVVSVS